MPVMRIACSAAARALGFVSSLPISRYEVIDVNSQAMKSAMRWSDKTTPSIAPAKTVIIPARRPTFDLTGVLGSCGLK